jgi:hypothetical protein
MYDVGSLAQMAAFGDPNTKVIKEITISAAPRGNEQGMKMGMMWMIALRAFLSEEDPNEVPRAINRLFDQYENDPDEDAITMLGDAKLYLQALPHINAMVLTIKLNPY